MTEINNNIPKYGYNTGKIEQKNIAQNVQDYTSNNAAKPDNEYVLDTGVVGRSQVDLSKDYTKSIEDAVELMKNNPDAAACGDEVFDRTYEQFVKEGMSEEDAYLNALFAQTEFAELASAVSL